MKPSVKYGLIYSGISILWSLVMYVTDLTRSDYSYIPQTLSIIVSIIVIRAAILEFQRTIGDGWISFNQAFREGMIVMAIGSVIIAIFSVVYNLYIDPTFMKFVMEKQANAMAEKGLTDDQIQKQMAMAMKMSTPGWLFVFALFGGLFIGSIISLIMAAIMKKPNPDVFA